MSVIYNRTFATGNQRYLNLAAEDYLRPLSIGTNWNRIRIGVLFAVGTVSGNAWPLRGPTFSLGVCNGILNSPGVLTATHVIGWGTGTNPITSSSGTWGYNAGTGGNSYFTASGWTFYKIANGALTTGTTGSFTLNVPTNAPAGTARRGICVLDINKSALISGNMTQGVMGGAAAHMSLDLTSSDLYATMEWYASAPTIQGTALNFLANGNSIAFNETTNGALDTVFLYWNHYTVPFELYELAVYRVG